MKMKDGNPICIMCGFLNGEQPSGNWKNYKIIKGKDSKDNKDNKDKVTEKKKEQKKVR